MELAETKNVTLYDLSKSYKEEEIIGDFRHPMWQRFAMKATATLIKNPKFRIFAFELSNMVKTNNINNIVLETIVENMVNEKNITEDEEEALKIVAAINNM